jgi:phospholipid-translocating ATPase
MRVTFQVSVSLPGGDGIVMDLDVLHVLPFDSTRKRMSVVLRHPTTNETVLYTKGADSSMFSRLDVSEGEEAAVVEKTQQQINNYARQGEESLSKTNFASFI